MTLFTNWSCQVRNRIQVGAECDLRNAFLDSEILIISNKSEELRSGFPNLTRALEQQIRETIVRMTNSCEEKNEAHKANSLKARQIPTRKNWLAEM